VFVVSGDEGVSVTAREGASYASVAEIGPEAPFSVKVDPVIDGPSMSRENVAVTFASSETPVAAAAGADVTEGGAGGVAAVVKLQETAPASPIPSVAPVIEGERVAVYVAPFASGCSGTSVAVCDGPSYAAVAGTLPLGPASVKLELVTVVGSSG
jgi:hypothetical protein